VLDQFDNTRRLLRCDVLDLYQAHAVTSLEELDRRSRAIEQIVQLREQGRTRFAGITGHDLTVPVAFLEALRRFDLDTVMFPVYPVLWGNAAYREPAEELLALCGGRDLGVMAIKAVAHRPWADRSPESGGGESVDARWATSWYEPVATDEDIDRGVHFALSTPGVHGFCTPGDIGLLPRVLDSADRSAPLSAAERQRAIDSMSSDERCCRYGPLAFFPRAMMAARSPSRRDLSKRCSIHSREARASAAHASFPLRVATSS
jgi:hypothetical protein